MLLREVQPYCYTRSPFIAFSLNRQYKDNPGLEETHNEQFRRYGQGYLQALGNVIRLRRTPDFHVFSLHYGRSAVGSATIIENVGIEGVNGSPIVSGIDVDFWTTVKDKCFRRDVAEEIIERAKSLRAAQIDRDASLVLGPPTPRDSQDPIVRTYTEKDIELVREALKNRLQPSIFCQVTVSDAENLEFTELLNPAGQPGIMVAPEPDRALNVAKDYPVQIYTLEGLPA